MRELYINNQLCDIDGEFNPTFQYKSFLFAKMQGYEAARTWEVSIPLTARNRAIIQQSQSADSTSTFPYTTHTVSYYSEGYPIVENGRAYMVGIIDNRVRFVFVIGETIQVLKELSEKKLDEIGDPENPDIIGWSRSTSISSPIVNYGFANFYSFRNPDNSISGSNPDLPYSVIHPVVKFTYILSLIENYFFIDLSSIKSDSIISDMVYLLHKRNGVIKNYMPRSDQYGIDLSLTNETLVDLPLIFGDPNPYYEIEKDADPELRYTFLSSGEVESLDFIFSLKIDLSERLILRIGLSEKLLPYTNVGGYRPYRYDLQNYIISIKPVQEFSFKFEYPVSVTSAWYSNFINAEGIMLPTTAFYSKTDVGYFPIVPNLPNMTCAEFLNQCALFAGMFPIVLPTSRSTISYYDASILQSNRNNAKDWSKYIIKNTESMSQANDITYNLSDFSYRNIIKYAVDNKNTNDNSGIIICNNQNIQYESDFAVSSFYAGSKITELSNIVDMVLYEATISEGVLQRTPIDNDKDIVGAVRNIDGINYLTFPESLKFSEIVLSNKYVALQNLLLRQRIIREKFRLTPRIISQIDVTIPVYLEQYGKYYAIMEAQIDGEYNADVTLLEI